MLLFLRFRRRARTSSCQFNPRILRDNVRNAEGHERDGTVVVALFEQRDGFPSEATHLAIRQNRFQPVASLNAVTPILSGEQDQHAAVGRLASNSPLLVQIGCVAFDVGVIERLDCDHRDLSMSFLIDLLTNAVELRDCVGIEDMSEVVDVVGRL
jgi:hypothetical protein